MTRTELFCDACGARRVELQVLPLEAGTLACFRSDMGGSPADPLAVCDAACAFQLGQKMAPWFQQQHKAPS